MGFSSKKWYCRYLEQMKQDDERKNLIKILKYIEMRKNSDELSPRARQKLDLEFHDTLYAAGIPLTYSTKTLSRMIKEKLNL